MHWLRLSELSRKTENSDLFSPICRFVREFSGASAKWGSTSFTLVELLIVIGILAILTSAVVITLNPAERLKEARDSTRIQELTSLEKTIGIVETQIPDISLGVASTVYISIPDTSATCTNLGLPTLPTGYVYGCRPAADYRKTNGTGWIPINFQASTVASFNTLPIDPTNTTSTGLYYTYMSGGSFELTALMESTNKSSAAISDSGMLTGVLQKGTHIDLTPATRDRGLVGYWTFDEGSGTTAFDHSGNGISATLYNGPIWVAAANCKKATCLSFDGINDHVDTAYHPVHNFTKTSDFTLSGWIKIVQLPADGNVIGLFSKSLKYGIDYVFSENRVRAGVRDSITTRTVDAMTASFNLNQFYHVAFTFTANGTMNLYVNGASVGTRTTADVGSFSSESAIFIGDNDAGVGGSIRYLNGVVDDLRIYSRALSAAEISTIYNAMK